MILEAIMQGIAKKTCDVLPMLTGFHSAVIEVADFESALGDYARMLGHEAPWIEHDASRRTRSALCPLA